MQIRWISNSRRATQRLGFCKVAAFLAGSARTRGEMVEAVRATISTSLEVPYREDLASWLRASGWLRGPAIGGTLRLDAQAYYIWLHPARSGWLSPKGVDEFVEVLPRRMMILDDVFRPTEAGLILAGVVMSQAERDAWIRPNPEANPLVLTRDEQYYFAHLVLSADGDFLIPWMGRLVSRFGRVPFTYLDAGEEIPPILQGMVAAFEPLANLSSDRRVLASIDSARVKIQAEIQAQRHKDGSGSRREQTSVPRLEWLVDLGVLTKQLGEGLTYSFTEIGANAANLLSSAYQEGSRRKYADTVLGSVLDEHYGAALGSGLWGVSGTETGPVEEVSTPDDLLAFLRPAYDAVAGYSGYCLLRPLVVLAATMARRADQRLLVEYSQATQLLEAAFREHPTAVHYTIDRLATDYQVRLAPAKPATR